jgi:hypothetical protein
MSSSSSGVNVEEGDGEAVALGLVSMVSLKKWLYYLGIYFYCACGLWTGNYQ